MTLLLRFGLACACGYALGSVQLGPFLLRSAGPDRAGGASALRSRGIRVKAAASALVDIAKGAAAAPLLLPILGRTTGLLVVLPAFCVVLGHRFPVFFRFRGGSGAEPTLGILLFGYSYGVYALLFDWTSAVAAVLVFCALTLALGRVEVPAAVASAFLFFYVLLAAPPVLETVATASASALLFGLSADRIVRGGLTALPRGSDAHRWRIAARPFALLFVVIDAVWSRRIALFVIGSVALVFIVTDLVRMIAKAEFRAVFKRKERDRFSSMTLFLVAAFLTFLLFPGAIPYMALTFITVGDFFGKVVGIRYGRRRLYRSKTLEGSLAFFAGSLSAAYLVAVVFSAPVGYVFLGSAVATIVELFSAHIDDNFTVSIVSGGFLAAVRYFSGV